MSTARMLLSGRGRAAGGALALTSALRYFGSNPTECCDDGHAEACKHGSKSFSMTGPGDMFEGYQRFRNGSYAGQVQ